MHGDGTRRLFETGSVGDGGSVCSGVREGEPERGRGVGVGQSAEGSEGMCVCDVRARIHRLRARRSTRGPRQKYNVCCCRRGIALRTAEQCRSPGV